MGFSAIHGPNGELIFGLAAGSADEKQPDDVCAANARLIKAAPDLYSALDWLLEQPPEHDLDGKAEKRERAAARKAAIDALALARGEL